MNTRYIRTYTKPKNYNANIEFLKSYMKDKKSILFNKIIISGSKRQKGVCIPPRKTKSAISYWCIQQSTKRVGSKFKPKYSLIENEGWRLMWKNYMPKFTFFASKWNWQPMCRGVDECFFLFFVFHYTLVSWCNGFAVVLD